MILNRQQQKDIVVAYRYIHKESKHRTACKCHLCIAKRLIYPTVKIIIQQKTPEHEKEEEENN